MRRILFVMLFTTALAQHAAAQNTANSGAQTAKLALSNAIELTFINGSGGTTAMPFTSLNDLVNGVESVTQEMRVRSNKTFDVTANINSTNFTYSGTSLTNNILPVTAVLEVTCTQANGGSVPGQTGNWKSFHNATPTTILVDCAPGGNQTFKIKYKATPGINTAPGSYTTSVTYTATQQ